MKKLFLALSIVAVFLLTGCNDMMNTPTKKVEEFLGKYQTMHEDVLKQLEDVIKGEDSLVEDLKKDYRDLMKKQYQNLSYKIKDETIDGDKATVEVEVEVFDYRSKLKELDAYVDKHKDEFYDDEKKMDEKKYTEKKIEYLKDAKEKVKYTMNFTLQKKNGKWIMDDISETERKKLHGLYED